MIKQGGFKIRQIVTKAACCPLFEAVWCQGENVIAVLLADVRSGLYLQDGVIGQVKSDTISQCQESG